MWAILRDFMALLRDFMALLSLQRLSSEGLTHDYDKGRVWHTAFPQRGVPFNRAY